MNRPLDTAAKSPTEAALDRTIAMMIRGAEGHRPVFFRATRMDSEAEPNSQRVKASRPLPIRVPKCPEPLPIHPQPRITSNGCSRAKSPARDRSNPHRLPAGKRLTARRRPP